VSDGSREAERRNDIKHQTPSWWRFSGTRFGVLCLRRPPVVELDQIEKLGPARVISAARTHAPRHSAFTPVPFTLCAFVDGEFTPTTQLRAFLSTPRGCAPHLLHHHDPQPAFTLHLPPLWPGPSSRSPCWRTLASTGMLWRIASPALADWYRVFLVELLIAGIL
jgi:hypothetical protein